MMPFPKSVKYNNINNSNKRNIFDWREEAIVTPIQKWSKKINVSSRSKSLKKHLNFEQEEEDASRGNYSYVQVTMVDMFT